MNKAALLFILVLMLTGCKKKDGVPTNTWTLGSTTYYAFSVARQNDDYFQAINNTDTANVNILRFHFSKLPAANGDYGIAGNLPFVVPSDQVSVEIVKNTSLTYYSTNHNSAKASVRFSGTKMHISIPSVWMYKSSNNHDSVQLTADITEY